MSPYDFFRRRLLVNNDNARRYMATYYTDEELEIIRLHETFELTKIFSQLDMIVHDDWSLTGWTRNAVRPRNMKG